MQQGLCPLILTVVLPRRGDYQHFIDKKTKAQRGGPPCQWTPSWLEADLDLSAELLVPRACALFHDTCSSLSWNKSQGQIREDESSENVAFPVGLSPSFVLLTLGCSLDTMTIKLLARVENDFRIPNSTALSR